MQFSPYLIFNGDCAEAFKFYEQTLGGKIDALMTFAGSPAAEHVPAEWSDKILHAAMTIDGQLIMASDAPPGQYAKPQGISVSIALDDRDKGEQIFNTLAEGGTVQMPYQKTFWASGFGMCVDRFGTPWMVNVGEENIKRYQIIAKKAGKIWKEHGALEYIEAVGDDLENTWGVPFTKAVKLKPGEVPFFSFIVFKSRADRDKVNKKVMNDPRLKKMMDGGSMPFEVKRMVYGGFKVLVDI